MAEPPTEGAPIRIIREALADLSYLSHISLVPLRLFKSAWELQCQHLQTE